MRLNNDIRKMIKMSDILNGVKYFTIEITNRNNKHYINFENGERIEIPGEVADNIISSTDPSNVKMEKGKTIVSKMDFNKLARHSLLYITLAGESTIIYDDVE